MVLGEGGIKMSKSKGNVINPDTVIKEYGADTLRIYEMFMGPFDQMIPWDTKGVIGVHRFIKKIYKLAGIGKFPVASDEALKKAFHKTIKKVSEDVELTKFNTAVSSMMEFVNAWQVSKIGLNKKDFADFLKILSPFAPHLSEELWANIGLNKLCCEQKWPKANLKLIEEKKILLIVQINGKVRGKIEVRANIGEVTAKKLALQSEKINSLIGKDKEIIKTIFVANKLVNFVVVDKKK